MAVHSNTRTAPAAQTATTIAPFRLIDLPEVVARLIPKVARLMERCPPPEDALHWNSDYLDTLRRMALDEAGDLSVVDGCRLYAPANHASYVSNNFEDAIATADCAAWAGMARYALQVVCQSSARSAEDILARMDWIAREAQDTSPHVAFPEAVEALQRDLARFLLTGVR